MSEQPQNGTPDHRLEDPTTDRMRLLARVGEAQMRLEAVLTQYEEVVAENAALRERLTKLQSESADSLTADDEASAVS